MNTVRIIRWGKRGEEADIYIAPVSYGSRARQSLDNSRQDKDEEGRGHSRQYHCVVFLEMKVVPML